MTKIRKKWYQLAMLVKDKLMDYLARRDHSEKELKRKLSKFYSPEEIEDAIEWARRQKWLPSADQLSERVASTLHRKFKGIHFINQYLREKGLPSVARNSDVEVEKALHLVKNKTRGSLPPDKKKLTRFLVSRGYDSETIRKVMYEKF